MDSRIRLTNMRGDERIQDGMFSYVRLEQRVPEAHPLRAVRQLTEQVLRSLSPGFDELYAASGRPSIAPEYILRALLLQVFYSIRSERLLVEQIDYNCCFAGSSAWAWTMRCGTTRCFRRTATGC
jgi:transposase